VKGVPSWPARCGCGSISSRSGRAVNNKNIDLAPDGKRMAALLPIEAKEAPEAQNHVVVLIKFLRQRKVPAGK